MEDDESSLLLAPTVKAKRAMNRITAAGQGVIWNRVILVILLALFAALALMTESQISTLQFQLQDANTRIEKLEDLTKSHNTVIERFNTSVTNQDVMKQVDLLESQLTATMVRLNTSLLQTQEQIQQQLDETVQELSTSVSAAEDEISEQVRIVKKDVEQYVIATQDQFSMENSFMVYQLAGTFTLLSCLISMWHMTAHLRKLNQPDVQRKILAILWMSPIYAVTSWFSLVFPQAEGYLAIVKDGYEAYIIYQFLSFCIAVLGKGDRNKVVDLLARHADHLTPPFRLTAIFEICGCIKGPVYESNRVLADEILLQCQFFAMQFVFFRPLTTTGIVVLKQLNYYGAGDGPMDYRSPQLYLTIIQNLSIFIAFTGLLKFYHAVDKELAWCRPFAKFLCIKGVVFMTFWQGLAISLLAQTTDVATGGDSAEWAAAAQNFLICLEMLLFSIAHFYCFPTEEWEEGYRVKHERGNFGDSIALGDFFSDLKLILTTNSSSKRKQSQSTIPEEEETDLENQVTDTMTEDDAARRLQEALNETLGDDADDPEIAEAKRRLLESNVLSPEFFDPDENDIEESEFDEDDARKQLFGNMSEDEAMKSLYPDEKTSLLAGQPADGGSSFIDALRPSIFTTVASIADREKLNNSGKDLHVEETNDNLDEGDMDNK